jgi:hypothetical protein
MLLLNNILDYYRRKSFNFFCVFCYFFSSNFGSLSLFFVFQFKTEWKPLRLRFTFTLIRHGFPQKIVCELRMFWKQTDFSCCFCTHNRETMMAREKNFF